VLAGSAALAYAYAGKADDAYRSLGVLAQTVNDPPTARWARQWRSRLETGVTRGEILAEMRRDQAPDEPVREWTVDKGGVLRKVELSSGLEAAQSFIRDQQQQPQGKTAQPSSSTEQR
jgi:hypothetical protein